MTTRRRAAWHAWVALWDRREPATALALVRIGVGLCLVYDLITTWRLDLIGPLYSVDGYAVAHDGWARTLLGHDPGPTLWAIALGAAACIAVGAGTRVACVVFAVVGAQLGYHAPRSDLGIDNMLRIVVMILALSQSHARWALDAWVWRRLGRPLPAEVPAWPRYLLLLQLVWIYFSGGVNKAGAEWGPLGGFTALENILSDPNIARLAPGWIAPITPLARLATAVTMAFELLAPLYLLALYYAETADRPGRVRRWSNRLRLRWVWIALGVSFHLGIAITLRFGIFPWGMLALYPVLLRPGELRLTGSARDHRTR